MLIQCFDSTNSIRLFHFVVSGFITCQNLPHSNGWAIRSQKNRQLFERLSHIRSQKIFVRSIADHVMTLLCLQNKASTWLRNWFCRLRFLTTRACLIWTAFLWVLWGAGHFPKAFCFRIRIKWYEEPVEKTKISRVVSWCKLNIGNNTGYLFEQPAAAGKR